MKNNIAHSNATEESPALTPDELTLLARHASSASGRGMSFWSDAAACGKRALLREGENATRLPVGSFDKPQTFLVGSAYHKLHELWRVGDSLRDLIDSNSQVEDSSVNLALKLFRGWVSHFTRNYWGETVSVEELLPPNPAGQQQVVNTFATSVTARTDLVVECRHGPLDRLSFLPAGKYIVDFKTAGAEYDEAYYTEGLQSIWYPLVYNMCYPAAPVKGIIFDVIIKPRRNAKDQSITRDNFRAYYAPALPRDEGVAKLRGLIQQGRANLQRPQGNRAECVKWGLTGIQKCSFLDNGCPGS